MKKLSFVYIIICVLLASCSDGDEYIDAIPQKSKLVASVDLTRYQGMSADEFLKTLFNIDNGKGIDVTKKIYAFESPNGFYGLCLAVSDQSALKEMLATNGYKLSEFRGYNFSVLGSSWVIGFDGEALLVMGPVTPNEQRNVMIDMSNYLGQDSDKGLRGAAIKARLDSIQEPVAIVSAMKSLPELMRSSLMLCSPTTINMDKLYYSAGITLSDNYIQVDGSLYSTDDNDEKLLQNCQAENLNPVSSKYIQYIDEQDFVTILLNTKTHLTSLTQGKAEFEKLFAALNASTNTNVDYKRVFDAASEEIMVGVPPRSGNLRLLMSNMDFTIGQSAFGDRVGRLADGTYYIGNLPNKMSTDNKLNNVLTGKRAAMIVNLKELQHVAPLPLLTNVQRVLGNKPSMVLTVR